MADALPGSALPLPPQSQLTTLFLMVLRGELQPSIKCVVKEIALHSVTGKEMLPFNPWQLLV